MTGVVRELPRRDAGAGGKVRMVDEELTWDRPSDPHAHLDLSSIRPAAPSRAKVRAFLLPPPGEPVDPMMLPGALSDVPPRDAVAAFAGYPPPPRSLLEAPFHALAIVLRRRALARARAAAVARKSPDVALYDAALGSADIDAVRRGAAVALVLLVSALTGALLLGETLGFVPGAAP